MKNLSQILFPLIFINVFIFSGCKKDTPSDPVIVGKQPFAEGVFIINEGTFSGTGTVSFYDRTSGIVQNDIFSEINGVPLGTLVQSIAVYDSLAFIVVNGSVKIEVVNAATFKSKGIITGLNSPRYFLGINGNKAYVSDWSTGEGIANRVAVINLQTLTISNSINTGTGPEKMIQTGDEVYVLNVGGFGIDSTITVIDSRYDNVKETIQIGKRPTGIVKASDGNIWVMCSGKGFNGWSQDSDSEGHLMKINSVSHTIEKDVIFPGTEIHPEKLAINKEGTVLYFLYSGGIYQMNVSSHIYEYTALVESGNFYNLGCDPVSNVIFASDPIDFQQDGNVYRFSQVDGAMINSVKVGVGPGEFCFR
jgi:hypothetical protein